jgi:hypothetical protein
MIDKVCISSGSTAPGIFDQSMKGWMVKNGDPVQQKIKVMLGEFALGALAGEGSDQAALSRRLAQAVRYYLIDRDSHRAGWAVPGFLSGADIASVRQVSFEVDGEVWNAFAEEAERQGVGTDELLQHAVLYLSADRDSGRLTQWILDDLDREDLDPGPEPSSS